jgi:hypothetical protein
MLVLIGRSYCLCRVDEASDFIVFSFIWFCERMQSMLMYVAGVMILVKQNVDRNTCPDLVARSVESIRFVSSEQSVPWTFVWNLHAELQVIEHCLQMLLEWSFEKILLSSHLIG